MKTTRLEAFSDGVLAIIITIMVLELKPPHEPSLGALLGLWPVMLSYVLSFVYIAIYWNNHHHLLQLTARATGPMLWANSHLLFWLSLVPFTTAWMGENHFARTPTIVYTASLFMPAVAFTLLQTVIIRTHADDSRLADAIGRDGKGKLSAALYLVAIAAGFLSPALALVGCLAVAMLWFVPDRRVERAIHGVAAKANEDARPQ